MDLNFQVKAGRFQVDKDTKKVKPCKEKGKIIVLRNQEQETHFKWINQQTKIQEIDLIVFAQDAVFEAMENKANTFVLRFQTDSDKYFFWLQEKADPKEVIQKINELINYVQIEEESERMQVEEVGSNQKKSQEKAEPQKKQNPSNTVPKPVLNEDFIARLTKNLSAAKQNQEASVTHLQRVFNHATIGKILSSFSEQEVKQVVQYLPQEQQTPQQFGANVRSAQFGQALDSLSNALNSQTAISIFAQMGLNQNYLHRHYGVHAFLKALIDWGKAQKKQ